jgi:tubulin beta
MQAGKCVSHMGTKFLEVVCDEHGIGSDGEYYGDNDTQLGRINVLHHEARASSTYLARCSSTSSPA